MMLSAKCRMGVRVAWLFLRVLILAVVLLPGNDGRARAQTQEGWSTPVNLSESDTASLFPDIAVDSAGHVYVVWGEFSTDTPKTAWPDLLMFRMWDGQKWSPTNDIAVGGHLPQIAVDSQGRLHVVRVADGLAYKRAWAQGNPSDARNWTADRDIGFREPYWPSMVVDSQDRIHVLFRDSMEFEEGRTADASGLCLAGCWGVFYTRSTDGGDSWSEPLQVDTPDTDADMPGLAVDSLGNVYAVWVDTTQREVPLAVSFSTSTDGGETWSAPVQITASGEDVRWPTVAVDSTGTIHVVWQYPYSVVSFIGYVTSSDGGKSWSEVEILRLPGQSSGVYSHGLQVDSADNLHLVIPLTWPMSPMGVSHFVRPPGGGWSAPTRISQNPCNAGSGDAELVIGQGNHLHAVWYDRLECELGHIQPYGRAEVFYSDYVSDAPSIASRPLPPMPTLIASEPAARPTPLTQTTASATPHIAVTPTAVIVKDTVSLATSSPFSKLTIGVGTTVLVMAIVIGIVVLRKGR